MIKHWTRCTLGHFFSLSLMTRILSAIVGFAFSHIMVSHYKRMIMNTWQKARSITYRCIYLYFYLQCFRCLLLSAVQFLFCLCLLILNASQCLCALSPAISVFRKGGGDLIGLVRVAPLIYREPVEVEEVESKG